MKYNINEEIRTNSNQENIPNTNINKEIPIETSKTNNIIPWKKSKWCYIQWRSTKTNIIEQAYPNILNQNTKVKPPIKSR